jgi:hypothetical protein
MSFGYLEDLDGCEFLVEVVPERCAVEPDPEAGIATRLRQLLHEP